MEILSCQWCTVYIILTDSIIIILLPLYQCYKEVKPGMYGDLGKPMEGCNQWYAQINAFPTKSLVTYYSYAQYT